MSKDHADGSSDRDLGTADLVFLFTTTGLLVLVGAYIAAHLAGVSLNL